MGEHEQRKRGREEEPVLRSSEVEHEGGAERGGPTPGQEYVDDAGRAAAVRGEHPIEPAEGAPDIPPEPPGRSLEAEEREG